MSKKRSDESSSGRTTPSATFDTADTLRPSIASTESTAVRSGTPIRIGLGDDRPTEIFAPKERRALHASRQQQITGSTVREMIRNPEHQLSTPLQELAQRARADLPRAEIDLRTSLTIQHEFEFDLRVGYRLTLKMFDDQGRCVEVEADVDSDGRELRRGSIVSHIVSI